jgi:hypothetical protein
MLERHILSTDQVLAGGGFTLALYIRNNAVRPVSNIKISLGTVQVGAGAGGAGNTGGTVFSPLDGSSGSFFVDSIAARGRLLKKVNLFVDPNAASMTYALPITIEFEDGEGKAFSVSETVNIPVLQESRVQVLSLEIPYQAVAGQAVPVSMEFANTGRTVLSNVLVTIEGDFPKENATYFVPRLEIGTSDFSGLQPASCPDCAGKRSSAACFCRHRQEGAPGQGHADAGVGRPGRPLQAQADGDEWRSAATGQHSKGLGQPAENNFC